MSDGAVVRVVIAASVATLLGLGLLGATGHSEAVEVVYDPSKISYERLLEIYWQSVDPTVRDRQFCDVG